MASNEMLLVNNSNNNSLKHLSLPITDESTILNVDSNRPTFTSIIINNGKNEEESKNFMAKANSMRNLAAKRPLTNEYQVNLNSLVKSHCFLIFF